MVPTLRCCGKVVERTKVADGLSFESAAVRNGDTSAGHSVFTNPVLETANDTCDESL